MDRNGNRRRQGFGACCAFGAQFREGREGGQRGDADAALRDERRRSLGRCDQQAAYSALVPAGRGRSPTRWKVPAQGECGGTITACAPPAHFAATWEFGGATT